MKTVGAILLAILAFNFGLFAGQHHHPKVHHRIVAKKRHVKHWVVASKGEASWYGCDASLEAQGYCPWGQDHTQGHATSSSRPFNTYYPMCASWKFKLGTWVKVENLKTHKSTACVIWDRGPGKSTHRTIDLSFYVKKVIGLGGRGQVAVFARPSKPYHMTRIEREVYEDS